MKCPECGEEARVYDTRDLLRRRICPAGHRFKTFEVLDTKAGPLKSYQVNAIRTSKRLGKDEKAIAEFIGCAIEVVQWYLKDVKPNKGCSQ